MAKVTRKSELIFTKTRRVIKYKLLLTTAKTTRKKLVLVVSKLFNTIVNDFDLQKSAPNIQVLVTSELVVSGTRCLHIMA